MRSIQQLVEGRQVGVREKVLVIGRDDHIGDRIGAVFLGLEGGDAEVVRRLREYLGGRIEILKFELKSDRVLVKVGVSQFAEEANRLGAAAADLARKGAPRNAISMFKQALELDPLSGATLYEMGFALLEQKKPAEALYALRRAREIVGDSLELLRGLARACVMTERIPAAVGYLERALELEPNNRVLRRELLALGRRPLPAPVPLQGVSAIRRRQR
jgi:tetratricopeptide (TPR) repeat protein